MTKDIADYDKYKYDYEKYWQDSEIKRGYEDQAERIAIKKLLPKSGSWFCDLGAGFGRLYDVYQNRFSNIILADYSLENLKKAQGKIHPKDPKNHKNRKNPNIHFISLDAYHLPFKNDILNCLMSVRLMHHLNDAPKALGEISRVLKPGGKLVLEYANKRHFLEILKALVGKSKMKPFSLQPSKRGEGPFYNFHPRYIELRIKNNELRIKKIISVSNLRHQIFKKLIPLSLLLFLEKISQVFLSPFRFGPSIFILAEKKSKKTTLHTTNYLLPNILVCPKCHFAKLTFFRSKITCSRCRSIYKIIDGIYDLRV